MQMPDDELDYVPVDTSDYSDARGDAAAPEAPPQARVTPRWTASGRHLALARGLVRQHRRAAWERLGFALTLGLAVALLSAFGAALLREPHPALLGCRFGGWALVLGLGVAFLLMAKAQLLRAYRVS